MGMVPIPIISPLTLSRSEEPVLGPTLPIFRAHEQSSNDGETPEERYSPSQHHPPPVPAPRKTEPESPTACPGHELNLFA
jgi:hypothetical protein